MKYMSEGGSDRLERIIEAARRILAEAGVEGLTMRGLAEASGVSPTTLYNRFGSKDNILSLIVIDNFERGVDAHRDEGAKNASLLDSLVNLLKLEHAETLGKQEFSKALTSMYFKQDNDRELPDMLYSMLCERIQPVLDAMQREKLIHSWVMTSLLGAEIADRFLVAVMKWGRGEYEDKELFDRILFSVLPCLAAFSAEAQSKHIIPLLKKVAARIT